MPMKHKVESLEGALLDAAVAKAEGNTAPMADGREAVCAFRFDGSFAPSSSWADGGPIIERERIAVIALAFGANAYLAGGLWAAHLRWDGSGYPPVCEGPTPLIAAMRAYVASKFGEEVELP